MKPLVTRLITAPICIALFALAPLFAEGRTWTSTTGQKLDAYFVKATEDSVVLKRVSDNQEVTVPLSRLSAEDRTWVNEKIAENPNLGPKPAAGSTPTSPAPGATPGGGGAAKPITGKFAELVTGDWALSEHGKLPFALFASKELSADRKYPLVVSLHGKSDNNENGKQIGFARTFAKPANYSARPCFIIAPLCYQPHGGTGGGWSADPGEETIDLIEELIDNLPIDEDRIYCVGYSMGGFGTCHLMAEEPRIFTAGVPIAGSTASAAGELKRHPIWLFHAADDPVVSVSGSRIFADTLKRSKVFKYTEFPTGGHGISGQVMNDVKVHEWLFQQKK